MNKTTCYEATCVSKVKIRSIFRKIGESIDVDFLVKLTMKNRWRKWMNLIMMLVIVDNSCVENASKNYSSLIAYTCLSISFCERISGIVYDCEQTKSVKISEKGKVCKKKILAITAWKRLLRREFTMLLEVGLKRKVPLRMAENYLPKDKGDDVDDYFDGVQRKLDFKLR
ncbi:hypothetical protein ACO02O_03325 [Dirofilaria immitis]